MNASAMREADYLRNELVAAKQLLAEAEGFLEAARTVAPDFGNLDCVQRWLTKEAVFRAHPVAVLPEGVGACDCRP